MVTEKIFDILFHIPVTIYNLIPNLPSILGLEADFAGIIEIFTIGNIFFPVDKLFLFLLTWMALSVVSMSKSFLEWLYKLIPLT